MSERRIRRSIPEARELQKSVSDPPSLNTRARSYGAASREREFEGPDWVLQRWETVKQRDGRRYRDGRISK